MTILRTSLRAIAMLGSAALLTACGGSSTDSNNGTASRAISIPFEAFAGTTEISCAATLQSLGVSGVDAALSDFKFFVHNVRLVTDEGAELPVTLDNITGWQTDGIALLDFQDYGDSCNTSDESLAKATNTILHGRVADLPVVIAGIRFVVGVPSTHNHSNVATATPPLNLPSMFWNWQGGYKHMRIDVRPSGGISRPSDGDWSNTTWNFHLGDTNCSPDPRIEPNTPDDVICEYNNRPQVSLDGFDENSSHIRVDYAALVAAIELSQDHAAASGCMSGLTDTECASTFDKLGLDFGAADDTAPSPQSVFSVTAPR
jgi:uncharacterized repeat protein (TIGR04052 family)